MSFIVWQTRLGESTRLKRLRMMPGFLYQTPLGSERSPTAPFPVLLAHGVFRAACNHAERRGWCQSLRRRHERFLADRPTATISNGSPWRVRCGGCFAVGLSGSAQGVAGGFAVGLTVGDTETGQAVEAPAGGDARHGLPVTGFRGHQIVMGAVEPGLPQVPDR
jgi:hypothetical protein